MRSAFKFIIVISVIIVLIPLLLFIINFYNHSISNDISDWGSFAAFFSFISSLVSLIVLGYITFIVTEDSYRNPRKWDAYETIFKNLEQVLRFKQNSKLYITELVEEMKKTQSFIDEKDANSAREKHKENINLMIERLSFFSDLYYHIKILQVRYFYIIPERFFKSEAYLNLLDSLQIIEDELMKIRLKNEFDKEIDYDYKSLANSIDTINPLIDYFIETLKDEVV